MTSELNGDHETTRRQLQTLEQLAMLVEALKDHAIVMLDAAGHVQTWNTGAMLIKGYTESEIIGKHFSAFYPPEDRERLPAHHLAIAAHEGRAEHEGWRIRKDGSRFWAEVVISAIYDDAGQLRGFAKVMRDMTERHRVDEQFQLLVQGVQDYAIFMLDPSGRVTTWNSGAQRIKGYVPAEILGKHFSVFYEPEDVAAGKPERLLKTARQEGHVENQGWRIRKDGSRFWADVVITALYDEQKVLRGFAKVTRDLTERERARERQQAEELISRQKDLRLKEIHHRVKNNLQVISSLLTLQSLQVPDPTLAGILQEVQNRVRAISLIHEKLYQSAEGDIDFREYLEDIVSMMSEGFRPQDRGIALVLEGEHMTFSMETAVPCGLVVNELLTNALKHGFPDGRSGRVEVRLTTPEPGKALLTIADDGVGLPAHMQGAEEERGMGYRIIDSLTNQLNGTYRLLPGAGTVVEVEFPVPARET
ncbi:MAG: PAS domain S-box protein [Dehalococcoidia bacterium]